MSTGAAPISSTEPSSSPSSPSTPGQATGAPPAEGAPGGQTPSNQFSVVPPAPAPAGDGQQSSAQGAPGGEGQRAPDAASQQFEAFTLPDGYAIDNADLEAFTNVVAGLEIQDGRLTQKGAQQLVDLFIQVDKGRVEALMEYEKQQTKDRDARWADELHKDPEIGGDKFPTTQANISALEKSGLLLPEFAEMLVETGYLGNPAVVRQLSKLGALLQESPTSFLNSPSGGDGRSPAQRLFEKSGHGA